MKTNTILKKLTWGLIIFIGLSHAVLAQKIQVSGKVMLGRRQFGITRSHHFH